MDMYTARRDITEIMLKTVLNAIQSIKPFVRLKQCLADVKGQNKEDSVQTCSLEKHDNIKFDMTDEQFNREYRFV